MGFNSLRGHKKQNVEFFASFAYNNSGDAQVPGYGAAVTNILNLTFLVLAGLLLWYGARRLPAAYSLYALAALVYPLFFPASSVPLLSYPRFTLTVFPLYIALAVYTRGRPKTHIAVVATGLVLLIVLTAKFAVFSWMA